MTAIQAAIGWLLTMGWTFWLMRRWPWWCTVPVFVVVDTGYWLMVIYAVDAARRL